jgi:hypothetical protein
MMNGEILWDVDRLVPCRICMEQIPVSEASNEEATDYVVYYFGLDCYDRWRRQIVRAAPERRPHSTAR